MWHLNFPFKSNYLPFERILSLAKTFHKLAKSCLVSHRLQPLFKIMVDFKSVFSTFDEFIKTLLYTLKFLSVFPPLTGQPRGRRWRLDGCPAPWLLKLPYAGRLTLKVFAFLIKIVSLYLFTRFFYYRSFLTTNKHNMKIFICALSASCWPVTVGTGHGTDRSLAVPSALSFSSSSYR